MIDLTQGQNRYKRLFYFLNLCRQQSHKTLLTKSSVNVILSKKYLKHSSYLILF